MVKNYSRSFLFTIIFLGFAIPSFAQPAGWTYSVPVDVVNKTSTSRTNYQELLIINTKVLVTMGQMQASGADIRIGDKCNGSITFYSHYIMADMNTDSTKIWVKVPSIPANSSTAIFLYFGNSGASSTSSFSGVFPNAKISTLSKDSIGGTNTYDWFELQANDTLFVKKGTVMKIQARVALIYGTIIANAAGESPPGLAQDGSGAGGGKSSSNNSAGSGGAGYGGAGGDGGYDAGDQVGVGGSSYGSTTGTTIEIGSSGGSSGSSLGGIGGGAVVIMAEYLEFGGIILCNGTAGAGLNAQNGGGGSGGGVLIWGKWVKINGKITANGGAGGIGTSSANDDGGGGSGGRIKVLYNVHLSGTLTTEVKGGAAGLYGTTAPGDGGTGTVHRGFHYFPTDSIVPASMDVKFSDQDKRICAGASFTLTARAGFTNYVFYKNSTQVASGANNAYTYKNLQNKDSLTVRGVMSTCFTDTKWAIIQVDTLPIISIQSDTAVCNGDTLRLKAIGASTYQWTGGPKTDIWKLTPSSFASYTVIGKDANGCADTAKVSAGVYDYPDYTAASGAEMCAGDSVTLSTSGSMFTLWENKFLQQTYEVKPTDSQYFFYEVFDNTLCRLKDSVYVLVRPLPVVYISGKSSVCPGESTTLGANGALFYQWSTGGTYYLETVSPKVDTEYSVKGKDENGCFSIAKRTVTIHDPAVISIAGDMEVCKGESTVLTASGGETYSWGSGGKKPSETVTPVITTSYPVVSVDSLGCKDTTVATVVVNNLPIVLLDLPASMDTVCLNDSPWPLSGASPNGGAFTGRGVSAGNFNAGAAGKGKHTITYTYSDNNGCTDSALAPILVDACAGVDDILNLPSIRIYPNPSTTRIIHVHTASGEYTIYDANGASVYRFFSRLPEHVLYLPELAAGIYTIRDNAALHIPVKLILE